MPIIHPPAVVQNAMDEFLAPLFKKMTELTIELIRLCHDNGDRGESEGLESTDRRLACRVACKTATLNGGSDGFVEIQTFASLSETKTHETTKPRGRQPRFDRKYPRRT